MTEMYLASLIYCNICTNTHVGVYPEPAPEDELECPSCGAQDSAILERYGPDQMVTIVNSIDGLTAYEWGDDSWS